MERSSSVLVLSGSIDPNPKLKQSISNDSYWDADNADGMDNASVGTYVSGYYSGLDSSQGIKLNSNNEETLSQSISNSDSVFNKVTNNTRFMKNLENIFGGTRNKTIHAGLFELRAREAFIPQNRVSRLQESISSKQFHLKLYQEEFNAIKQQVAAMPEKRFQIFQQAVHLRSDLKTLHGQRVANPRDAGHDIAPEKFDKLVQRTEQVQAQLDKVLAELVKIDSDKYTGQARMTELEGIIAEHQEAVEGLTNYLNRIKPEAEVHAPQQLSTFSSYSR